MPVAGAGARWFIAWRSDLGSRLVARERVHDRNETGGADDARNPFGSTATAGRALAAVTSRC